MVDEIDVSGHVSWSAEGIVWNQISTIVVDAWSNAFSSRGGREAHSPVKFSGVSVNLWWMAELLSEEWSVGFGEPRALSGGRARLFISHNKAWVSSWHRSSSSSGLFVIPLAESIISWSRWAR